MIPSPRAVARHLDLAVPWRPAEDPLDAAYRLCAASIRAHSRGFYFAGLLLPPEPRRAMFGLYAFCRRCDDAVDQGGTEAARCLEAWRAEIARGGDGADPVVRVWHDLRRRYGLDGRHAEELLLGVEQDLNPATRYPNLHALLEYCYRVASTVGLLSLPILGWTGTPPPCAEAIALGQAMQLTNILRDIGEDARLGRVYLPLDLMARHSVTETDLRAERLTPALVALIEVLAAEAEALYQAAWPGIRRLAPDSRLGIAVAAVLYRQILLEVRRIDYDVFRRRAHTTLPQKVRLAVRARAWLRAGTLPPLPPPGCPA